MSNFTIILKRKNIPSGIAYEMSIVLTFSFCCIPNASWILTMRHSPSTLIGFLLFFF